MGTVEPGEGVRARAEAGDATAIHVLVERAAARGEFDPHGRGWAGSGAARIRASW
ncbi:hypothetical protein [Embleya sp. NBC_00896]|uniref:hypothetical protein n=1 Tax=Embleya sp. NBC_00896 TaxID=2975961 RepID=UPI0038637B99|nr:hypothetical protein OG928_00390 [Embleya sp. NBC_00896]